MMSNSWKTAFALEICLITLASTWVPVAAATPWLARTQQRLEAGEAVTIVCLGDSVTGVYYHSGGRRSYPELLEATVHQAFPAAQVRVINAGVSGNRTADGLARLRRDVIELQPDLVVVMFGLNDMEGVPVARFKRNLEELATQIQASGAEVLLCTTNDVIDSPLRRRDDLIKYVTAIRGVCRSHSLALADVFDTFESLRASSESGFRQEMNDEIHPNLDGHRRIAATVAKAIVGHAPSLEDVPSPAIPILTEKLKQRRSIRILTLLPEDATIKPALQKLWTDATIEELAAPHASLDQISKEAEHVRGKRADLVVVGLPYNSLPGSDEDLLRVYNKLLNGCFTGGQQEWDVIVVPPSVFQSPRNEQERQHDELVKRIIRARDLPMIERPLKDARPAGELLAKWLITHGKVN
jgi:lysophospholipase L1-like esterase